MLNYVRHDEEFHCSIRLKYGAEVLGICLVTHDDETGKDVVYIQNPVEVNVIVQERPDGKTVRGMGFSKWCAFSDEEFYILDGDEILTMSALGKDIIALYEGYLLSEEEEKIKDLDLAKGGTPSNQVQGSIGKIDEARQVFERLFRYKSE
jgi:hypothetical protein